LELELDVVRVDVDGDGGDAVGDAGVEFMAGGAELVRGAGGELDGGACVEGEGERALVAVGVEL